MIVFVDAKPFVVWLEQGFVSLNIHTLAYPGGELRAQFTGLDFLPISLFSFPFSSCPFNATTTTTTTTTTSPFTPFITTTSSDTGHGSSPTLCTCFNNTTGTAAVTACCIALTSYCSGANDQACSTPAMVNLSGVCLTTLALQAAAAVPIGVGTNAYIYANCPPRNECVLDEAACWYNSTCVDTPASYSCSCYPGYASLVPSGADSGWASNPCRPFCANCSVTGLPYP